MSQTYKVVLLGEGRVGKTSLVSRFVNDQFSDSEVSTVQANMYNKKRVDVDGRGIDLSVWDTAGQERFHALGPIYYRNADGAVLVYDITDGDTFEKVKMWIRELKKVVGDNIKIVICGNKSDMEKERDVEVAFAETYAKQQGAQHFSTSAKLNMNVMEAFSSLARAIDKANELSSIGSGKAPGKKKKGVQIDMDGGASSGSSSSAPPAAAASSGGGYDYVDVPPQCDPEPSSGGDGASEKSKPPRKNTITLSEAPKKKGPDGSEPKKKTGCCK